MVEHEEFEYLSPFFSVIITAYNRSDLIKRALDSLIAQIEKDWEAIIIDDGSTDDTSSQIVPYLKWGKNIRYFRQSRQGAPFSKNRGIHLSKGKFLTFLDSDDEYDPVHLKMRKSLLMADPELEFIYGGAKIIGNQYVPDKNNYEKMIHLSECAIGGTFFIKRKLASDLNGFVNIPLGSDSDFFERVHHSGAKTMKMEAATYFYYRENENSITGNLQDYRDQMSGLEPNYTSETFEQLNKNSF